MCLMAKAKKSVGVSDTDTYDVTFHIGPDKYEASGDSVLSALQKIQPKKFMGICKVEVTHKGKHSRLPISLVPTQLVRVFAKPIELALLAKRLNTLL
jgi:hypothetical protein